MFPSLKTPLAWTSLTYDKGRLLVSLAGIGLAVTMMFIQIGFRNAMFDSQAEMIARLNADLIMISTLRELLFSPEPFPRARLQQAMAQPRVKNVFPLFLEGTRSVWKNLRDQTTRPVRVIAFDTDQPVFNIPEIAPYRETLKLPDTVLFDTRSRDYYGQPRPGMVTELAGKTVTVVGEFRLGTDFTTDGNVIMSVRNFSRFFPDLPSPTLGVPVPSQSRLAKVDVGVIQLHPSADPEQVQAALRRTLPPDVNIMTKQQFEALEKKYWNDNTAVGYVFALGTAVGFMVGMVICYQILYANVLTYLPQFATLKAIGYTDAYLVGLVLRQAVLLALLGFLPALAVSQAAYSTIAALTGLLMRLTLLRVLLVLVMTVGMCTAAGCLAVRKVLQSDPAEVF